jgi:hypothetical protein
MRIEVDVDPDDVLEDMGLDEIVEYLKEHYSVNAILDELKSPALIDDLAELVNNYWHGDLNLKALLKELGPIETEKITHEIIPNA